MCGHATAGAGALAVTTFGNMELNTQDYDEELLFEPTLELAADMCMESGHMPRTTVADNGFTYETTCARCGELIK